MDIILRKFRFAVSDTARAAEVLRGVFPALPFTVQDDRRLRMDGAGVPVAEIVAAFVQCYTILTLKGVQIRRNML